VMVRAHRQAWCWQDEWYGLTIEDIRQLELETQLALARKMAQYSLTEEGQVADASSSHHHQHHHRQEQGQENQELGAAAAAAAAQEVDGSGGREASEARGELTKQWSTSSRSSNRSSKRGGEHTPILPLPLSSHI